MPHTTDRKPLNRTFSYSRGSASEESIFISGSFDYKGLDYSQYSSKPYNRSDTIYSDVLLKNNTSIIPLDDSRNFNSELLTISTLWSMGTEGNDKEVFSRPNRNRSQSVNHAVTCVNDKSSFPSIRPRSSSVGTNPYVWSTALSTISNDKQSTSTLVDLKFEVDIISRSESESGRKTNMENNYNKNVVSSKSFCVYNNDTVAYVEELTQIFSCYRSIKNIQLFLGGKNALIHMYSQKDPYRASKDIINRLGPCVLRLNNGKVEKSTNKTSVTIQITESLWLGSIPSNITQAALKRIFTPFGTIKSINVSSHKRCGFINFEAAESASAACDALLQNKIQELMGVHIGFGKVPMSKEKSVESNESIDIYVELRHIMKQLGANNDSLSLIKLSQRTSYFRSIPPVPANNSNRILDGSKLKNIRERLDNTMQGHSEADEIAYEYMNEMTVLCSDYIGNTVVQRLFEKCSDDAKTKMLENVVPHLAAIGIHRNGTWAAQKIINLSNTEKQIKLVCKHLLPFIPALLLDPFGNYVVQCCLRLNCDLQFIVNAIVDNLILIVQGRFGSRAVRGILESRLITPSQQASIAAAIIQNTVPLSTQANGILVLSWLVDSPLIEGKRWMIASRVAPYIGQLAIHKLGSHILLKLIHQNEKKARQCLLRALADERTLLTILSDDARGLPFALKVISNQQTPEEELVRLQEITHSLLTQLQGTEYKKATLEFISVE